MNVTLESLATCFQGLLPAMLFTCSQDGVPKAAYLSHVDYVDARHVALSYQFFTRADGTSLRIRTRSSWCPIRIRVRVGS